MQNQVLEGAEKHRICRKWTRQDQAYDDAIDFAEFVIHLWKSCRGQQNIFILQILEF